MAGRRIFVVFGLLLLGIAAQAQAEGALEGITETTADTGASSLSTPVDVEKSASVSEAAALDGSPDELSRLLEDEAATRLHYNALVKKMNKYKWAAVGLGSLLGGATLMGVAKGLHSLKQEALTRTGKAIHLGSAGIGLLSLLGGIGAYYWKKKAEERAKDQAKELIRHRQAMLAELQEGDRREAEVMERADEIADITESLGLYDSEIDAAMRAVGSQ